MAIDWDAVKKRAKQVDDSYYGERKRSERTAQPSDSPSFPRSELTGLAYEALRSGTLPMTTPAGRVTVPTGAAAQRASMLRDYAQLADDQKRGRLEGELYQLTQPGRVYNQETTQRNRARAAEIQGELDGLLPRESGRFKSGVQSILSSAMGAVPAIAATAKSLDWSIGEERNREESRQLAELDRKIRALEGSRRGDALDHIRGTDEWKALAAQRRALSLQATPAVDMDDPGMRLMRESNQYREQALEGLEGVPRFLGGTALSIGQNAALLPLATVNPALPLAAMGTISAADRMYELGERGLPASEALSRGLISGGIEAATEKIPLDTLLDAMKTGGKGALRNILRQAGTEAGEESVSYLANYLMDKAYKDPEAEFSLAELAQAAAGGALSGGVFGGFGSAYNAVGERLNQPVALPVAAPVDRDVTTGYDGTKPYRRGDMNDGRGEEAPSAARDIYGADVWGEAQKTYPGGKSTHPQADRTVGSQRPAADWAKGHIVERPATPAGAAAARAGRYLPDVFVVDDAALKAQNPSAWALTQDGVTYISDALPAELADIVGYHEAVHAVKQRGFPEYHTLLDQIGGSLNHQSDRTDLVLGVILRSRFQGKEIMDLNLDELMTAYDELNALVWGYYKADPDNARTQFAGVFRDYDKYIRLLDGVMEAGRMAETPPIAVPRQTQGPVDLPIAERRAQTPPLADENGETTSVGAAPMGFDEWSHFQNQSGQFFPEGANAARPVDVPTTDPSGRNIRKTASTAMGARAIPDEVVGDIQQMVLSGQLSYDRVTDQDSIRRAIAQIEQDGGFQRALGDFSRAVQKGVVSKDLATLGQQLLVNAANAGDGKATAELLSLYAQMETAAGQAVQAASILRKLDPSYQLYAAQKAVDRLQETLSRKLKGRDITIDPALIEKFEQQTDQAGRDAVLEEIYQNVADQVPATWQDKWNAWRYLAMLGNPRTHIRNIAGNAGFMPVRFVKDRVAATTSVGAAPMGFDEWSHFQNQSGQFFPEGANAARPVDVPTTDPSGRNIRKTASTAMGARAIPDEVVGDIQQMVLSGQLSYDRVTDQDSIRRAIAQIEQDGGFQRALGDFSRAVQKGVVSKDLATLGQQLLVNAANAGDGKATAELLSLYAQMETAAGQAVQAASILRKLDPSYQLYAAQKAVDRLQETLSRKLKGRDITIDPALIEKFEQQTDQAGRDAVLEEIYQNVADQVPATWQDKWNAWRYLAMLGNPRTHIRNIAGNAGFMPVRFVKDRVAALIEAGISAGKDGFQRTKSFAYDPKLYAAAWADYPNVAEALSGSKYDDIKSIIEDRRTIFQLKPLEAARRGNSNLLSMEDATNVAEALSGSKYDDIKSIIEDRRTIFQLKPLEAARRGNSNLLSMEDATAKRVTYAGALAGYLNANGVTAEQLRAGTADPKVLNAARNYAGQEAQRATFNDKNQFSDTVVRTARSLGTLGEAVLPFKRTPANILVRGLEYSPAGLAKSVLPIKLGPLKGDLYKVRKGEMSAAEAIDHAAAGLTGTGLLALGAYLASLGLVSGGADDDEKQEALDDLVGRQSYALNLPGGGSVTLDWLAPEALPFFMGAQLFRSLGENGLTAESITDALTSVSEPMLEMSMLLPLPGRKRTDGGEHHRRPHLRL